MHKVLQHLGTAASRVALVPRFLQLIAYAPQHHAGMVAVAHYHVLQVFLPPFVKILRIKTRLPLVKRLVDDHKAHPVTKVEELRCGLVVAATDGIRAIRLDRFQFTLHGTQGQCPAKTGIILMQAKALQFHPLPVQQETAVWRKLASPDTEHSLVGVHQLPAFI